MLLINIFNTIVLIAYGVVCLYCMLLMCIIRRAVTIRYADLRGPYGPSMP